MFEVTVSRDGKQLHYVVCKSLCLSYNDGSRVSSVVSADPDVNVSDVAVLGCAAASAALRATSLSHEEVEGRSSRAEGVDVKRECECTTYKDKPVHSDVVLPIIEQIS